MNKKTDIIRPTDDEARALAKRLLNTARYCAIATLEPGSSWPMVTRVAVGFDGIAPLILVSNLSQHTAALRANPACSVLLSEANAKGDPLMQPRLTVKCKAEMTDKEPLRQQWLAEHPKAKLYFDFTDFEMFRLVPETGFLNGGFGKAFHLLPSDWA
ncbi:MAG: pyridoxamine 5-phosphate oxidase [Robiginitomaculum sp.]|nr:MAG: pyridoxamine 5-phosphate oxidase [Robiginitomaculum sp.]